MESRKHQDLERENQNLRIANQVKDLFIEQLKSDQNKFGGQLLAATHKVGVLETKLLQIESPSNLASALAVGQTPTSQEIL